MLMKVMVEVEVILGDRSRGERKSKGDKLPCWKDISTEFSFNRFRCFEALLITRGYKTKLEHRKR